ncbi:MAG: hypothetical protein ACRELC_06830, partial [Gemmatimonadota bacterium]
ATVGPAASAPTPSPGDSAHYYFALQTDLEAACTDTSTLVRGVVRAVRDHVVLVEDGATPASGAFTPETWEALADDLDRRVVPVDTAYFGGSADLDGNRRLVLLFTPAVNRLSPAGAPPVGGFFLPLDLAASGRSPSAAEGRAGETCPASNEAELLYLAVPDPEGELGAPRTAAEVVRDVGPLVAHELQHLVNAERRVLFGEGGFAAVEELWLDEALSAIAEEVVGLAALELAERGDYTLEAMSGTREQRELFEAYHLGNFFNLSLFLSDPAATPVVAATDPGGVDGLRMRGFGWLLLRWLGDHADGDAQPFLRRLASGGPNQARGVPNVEQAAGRRWDELLSEFAVTVAADDAGVQDLSARYRILTWNFRDVFASLSRDPTARSRFPVPFPLRATPIGFETTAIEFDVGASTVRYFALVSGLDSPAVALTLSSPDGRALDQDARPHVTIVRTR